MINKIIASYILFACLLAIAFKAMGVDGTVHFGSYFQAYIVQTNRDLINFKIAIPDIPMIPEITESGGGWDVLQVLVNFVNGIVQILNILLLVVNTLIQVIEMIFFFLKNLITMKNSLPTTIALIR